MRRKDSKKKKEFILRILKSLACAYIYIIIVVISTFILFSEKIENVFSTIEFISIEEKEPQRKELKIDKEKKRLNDVPTYGLDYGRVKIQTLDIDLPLYYGDSLDILKNGIGNSIRSYSPGEGKTVICTGHNIEGMLKRLPEIKENDKIVIETTYGNYTYKVSETKILAKNDKSVKKVQKEKEILVLYTGYPTDSIGITDKIFVVYADLVEE